MKIRISVNLVDLVDADGSFIDLFQIWTDKALLIIQQIESASY